MWWEWICMELLYAITTAVFCLILTVCLVITCVKKTQYKRLLIDVISCNLLCLLSYIFTFLSDKKSTVNFLTVFFYTSFIWFIFSIARLLRKVCFETTTLIKPKVVLFMKHTGIIIASIDSLVLFSNLFADNVIKITQGLHSESIIFTWIYSFQPLFLVHIISYMLFLIAVIIELVIKSIKTPTYYRRKYIFLFSSIAVIILLNILFFYINLKFDLSLFIYSTFTVILCYYVFYLLHKDSKELLSSVISEVIPSGIACFDFEGKCIYANKIAKQLFNIHKDNFKPIEDYLRHSWLQPLIENYSNAISGDDTFILDNEEHIFGIEYQKYKDNKNRGIGSYLKLDDHTFEIQKLNAAKFKATHDTLTGLYNRNTFFEMVEKEIRENPDIPRYMVATNIKNFKLLNDMFGTKLGDSIIKTQAQQLQMAKYEDCIFGRISADRFGMLIRIENFNEKYALKNTQNILSFTKSLNYRIKVYIGVYEIFDPNEPASVMYDKAILAIKNIQGDYEKTISYYDLTMMDSIYHEKAILSEFARALRSDEFKMYLQPLTDKKGNCKSCEALVRWQHPLLGLLSPSFFISILEKTGYILQLDLFIWEKALQKLREWQEKGINDISISVNISPKDFLYTDLYITITDLVEKYGIEPKKLNLEITETALMTNVEANMEVINSLKEYGFTIEIDDFGTGFSSLNMLKELNTDVLKIDMGFLKDTENKERSNQILKYIFNMAKELNIDVITEGVETEEQLTFLSKSGCKKFQGFYFSKAVPIQEFESKFLGGSK